MKSRYVAILLIFTVQLVKAQAIFAPLAYGEMNATTFNELYAETFNECMSSTVQDGGTLFNAMNSSQAKQDYCKNYATGSAQQYIQTQEFMD